VALAAPLAIGIVPALQMANVLAVPGVEAALAGFLPARRASRTDPIAALRVE